MYCNWLNRHLNRLLKLLTKGTHIETCPHPGLRDEGLRGKFEHLHRLLLQTGMRYPSVLPGCHCVHKTQAMDKCNGGGNWVTWGKWNIHPHPQVKVWWGENRFLLWNKTLMVLKITKLCRVAKGYNQKQGTDYDETFSPTADMSCVGVIMEKAAQEN